METLLVVLAPGSPVNNANAVAIHIDDRPGIDIQVMNYGCTESVRPCSRVLPGTSRTTEIK